MSSSSTPQNGLPPEMAARIRQELADQPGQMTLQVAARFGVPEAEVIRLLPAERCLELDVARWEEMFRALEGAGEFHLIVSNGSVTCETVGEFGGFSTWGEFFNVQSGSLDMHVRWQKLGSVFAVLKPGHLNGGQTLSLQFYDREGNSALKVFLNFSGKPTAERHRLFEGLRERFGRPAHS